MVNLEILRDVLRKERRVDELIELDNDFYSKAGKYIQDLEKHIKNEENENKELMLKDEKESSIKMAQKLFERRMGKIIRLASLNARGLEINEDKMTNEENDMFKSLTKELNKGREIVKEKIFSRKEKIKNEGTSREENFNNSEKPLTVVKVLENFPKFVGSDERSYNLSKEDIISLPQEDSNILIERGIVEEIEGDYNENA